VVGMIRLPAVVAYSNVKLVRKFKCFVQSKQLALSYAVIG